MLLDSIKRAYCPAIGLLILALMCAGTTCSTHHQISLTNMQLTASVRSEDGGYEIKTKGLPKPVLVSHVAAEINGRWISSSAYPQHHQAESTFQDALGSGHQVMVAFTGLSGSPELDYVLRLYDQLPYGDIEVKVRNTTGGKITVQAIRSVEAVGQPLVNLGGPENEDRILSDSFSEDRPPVHIYDLGQAPVYLGWDRFGKELSPVQLGVDSQLIYNRKSGDSLLLATLTSRLWLTYFRLGVTRGGSSGVQIGSYDVDSAGTTEVEKKESLNGAPAADQIQSSLPLQAGKELASERLMFAAGSDYHSQLEAYGKAIRLLHHARVESPNLMGWWSWTAFYRRVNEHDVSANAHWLAKNLKPLGYDYFHIDEGYGYARGDYIRPNPATFPHGMRQVGKMLGNLGLKMGVWTAPFEVSERAWVYQHHKDWLVHNANGQPIRISQPGLEPLYVLDATNPGAQQYLRQTYQTMVKEWGVKYIKLDFMDDTSIEGYRYRPDTTALEAQRIGLQVIREAVGQSVLLDKDGSPMLNPVGILDEGRISLDTAHSFQTAKDVATGIAARYYMNRNFFVTDPDAFQVSKEVRPHQKTPPLTLNEAEVSIVQAALSGGMYEIGDNLPLLASEPARLALLKNADLLHIVHLRRAATPIDLMSYSPQDGQPSELLLREDKRQTMLAVFNWTDQPRSHELSLSALGLTAAGPYKALDVFKHDSSVTLNKDDLELQDQAPHSVRLIKIIDTSLSATSAE
jgi:alpha-galactosidase